MKQIHKLLLVVSCLLAVACSKDESFVNIVSVNTFGNTVCRNDVVKVFVSVETDNKDLPTYEWGCEDGKMTNPQGLFENVWQAPDKAGKYKIWVKVKSGRAEDTHYAYMTVTDEYYYTNFETPYYGEGWSNTNMTVAIDSKTGTTPCLSLTSKNNNAVYYRNWSKDFAAPISMQVNCYPKTFSGSNTVSLRIIFTKVVETNKILENVSFNFQPGTGVFNISSAYVDVPNGTVVTLTGTGSDAGTNAKLKYKNAWKHISLSLDASNKVIVYCEGEKILESDFLKTNFPQSAYPIHAIGLALPNKVVALFDDLTVMDNGTVLTGTAIDR